MPIIFYVDTDSYASSDAGLFTAADRLLWRTQTIQLGNWPSVLITERIEYSHKV